MIKFTYSIFVISLLISLYGCAGSSSASKGVNMGKGKIGMMDS